MNGDVNGTTCLFRTVRWQYPRGGVCKCATPRRASFSAFTLVEIIVAISLLTFIMIGLMATFNQVQRSFKSSVNQSDVHEPGRAIIDMMTRDLEQMTPAQFSSCPNFYAQPNPLFSPLEMGMLGPSSPPRMNVVEDIFFMSRINQDWAGNGYTVSNAVSGVGTLYRYYRQIPKLNQMRLSAPTDDPASLFGSFYFRNPTTTMGRIADGVVNFQVRAYDPRGNVISNTWANILVSMNSGQFDYSFYNNAVPAYLEIELGMLEPQILDRAKGFSDLGAQRAYLSNNTAHVQIFRQRIPIRNVDPSAYPY
jgi:hypothetical protein